MGPIDLPVCEPGRLGAAKLDTDRGMAGDSVLMWNIKTYDENIPGDAFDELHVGHGESGEGFEDLVIVREGMKSLND